MFYILRSAAANGRRERGKPESWDERKRGGNDSMDVEAARAGAAETCAARGDEATLVYRGQRVGLRGRALKLIVWVASRQERINETAPLAGQLWVTWKGDGPRSIDGDIKAPL